MGTHRNMWTWVKSFGSNFLSFLGIMSAKQCRMLLLGLDCAGKTTMLKMLQTGQLGSFPPTAHATVQECRIGGLTVQAWDVGGHRSARRVWKDYFVGSDAVVYLVDASDRDRFQESKEELQQLLACEELASVPILILGNKVDIATAASEEELRHCLGVHSSGKERTKLHEGERPVEVFMCSIIKRFGYGDGFKWLTRYL